MPMAPQEPSPSGSDQSDQAKSDSASSDSARSEINPSELGTAELVELLRADRLWLLRQIDAGRWSEWRLDLAALERELGQLLEQAEEGLQKQGS